MTTPVGRRPCRPHGGEDELGAVLEARFQGQTDRLIELTSRYRFSRDAAVAASIASARASLADTARALRRIAEGRYGACEHCGLDIPRSRLRDQPQASLCPRCDRSDTPGRPRSGRYQPV
jgi:DnaK suppressor protein